MRVVAAYCLGMGTVVPTARYVVATMETQHYLRCAGAILALSCGGRGCEHNIKIVQCVHLNSMKDHLQHVLANTYEQKM